MRPSRRTRLARRRTEAAAVVEDGEVAEAVGAVDSDVDVDAAEERQQTRREPRARRTTEGTEYHSQCDTENNPNTSMRLSLGKSMRRTFCESAAAHQSAFYVRARPWKGLTLAFEGYAWSLNRQNGWVKFDTKASVVTNILFLLLIH
jgi:hypothetical protein